MKVNEECDNRESCSSISDTHNIYIYIESKQTF